MSGTLPRALKATERGGGTFVKSDLSVRAVSTFLRCDRTGKEWFSWSSLARRNV